MSSPVERLNSALADRYRIERELGAGGMATVYLAHDEKHDRDVAIKVLHPELAAALGGERFLAEIKTTARLQHPHILPLLDSGSADGLLYYVMPYATGETLRARIERERQLPIADALGIAREVADALGAAHALGIIHRDIKPENILLQGGHALVADFGIALAVQSAGGARMTQTGLSLGTPQYMSPEQAMGEKVIDARSDIYALGAVTYEMLAGEPPFTGPTVQSIIARVMAERPTPLHTLRDTIPEAVESAVLRTLAKLPADRFSTAMEFAAALAGGASPATASRPARGASAPRSALRVGGSILVAAGLVAVTVFVTSRIAASGRPARPMQLAITLPDFDAIGTPGLSSDGTMIAYNSVDARRMYVRALADTSAVIVARGEGFWVQTFSPDGKLLAFVTGFPGMLKVVSIDGASERTLVASKVFATGLAWSDDGWIYFGQGERYGRRLMRVRAAGGAPELVAEPDSTRGEVAFGQFSVMPGGRTLLLTVRFTSGEPQVATLDLRTHTVTRLVKGLIAGYITSGQLVVAQRNGELQMGTFDAGRAQLTSSLVTVANGLETANNLNAPISVAPSGSILYQARVPDGQIVWVTRDGHETPVDPKWHGRFEAFALSPDGKQLALGIVTGARTELWVKAFPDGPLGRVFEGTNTAYRPVWFPDGKTIGFTGDVFGPLESFTVQADASAPPERLISDPRSVDELVVSRDGRWIVYRQGSGTDRHLYLMARGVDSTGRPLFPHAASAQSFAPAISPDGKWIAYTGDESGRNEVYLRPFPNAADAKYIVSRNGGAEPVWAHSGRELFFRDNNNVLVAASLALGATANVTALTPLFPTARYFLESRHSAYDVSADDRRFLFATDSSLAVTPQIHFTTNLAAIYRARAAR